MTFDQWWKTLTPAEQRLIGENNAKFVWNSAVEECAKEADVWIRAYEHPSKLIAENIRRNLTTHERSGTM